jgi:hypothetical protein
LVICPLLLGNFDQPSEINISAFLSRAGSCVIERVENLTVDGGSRFTDGSLNRRLCVVGVLREEFEERLGEWGSGVVVGIDYSINLLDLTCVNLGGGCALKVLAIWLGVLVGVRLALGAVRDWVRRASGF